MDKVVANILDALRHGDLDAAGVDRIVRQRSAEARDGRRIFAKKHILPYYLAARQEGGQRWESWNVNEELDAKFVKAMQMKPRRTASGVATITVLTKPWRCANECIYCPNDPNMPKSYLSDEPACQRAERNLFHPYLQVASRLRTLEQMGHATDKVELIVLGGTWLDYPQDYRIWFTCELFRALNAGDDERGEALHDPNAFATRSEASCSFDDIEKAHRINETAAHRVVGLVFETRPDTITPATLTDLRRLGCTKVQLGVQSIRDDILELNGRHENASAIADAFELCRLFGFKIHAHFMVNLLGATPDSDVEDFLTFATSPLFSPDEVKLYPCALVAGTRLVQKHEAGEWRPYTEEELIQVLSHNLCDSPPYLRISRMIRDISANDILVGNKKTNLRQLVESYVAARGDGVCEIRFREIGTGGLSRDELELSEVSYQTRGTQERFLQWITPEGRIAAFLRLSLPDRDAVQSHGGKLPVAQGEAMIREVHVYGFAAEIDKRSSSAQHHGLGRSLVERACDIARSEGYVSVNVISAIGTREYYRKLGFHDSGLYQKRVLQERCE